MAGQELEIGFASAMLIFLMATLAILLIGLAYGHRMPDDLSSYSVDNRIALPLGSAYLVNYSSTTLNYIASQLKLEDMSRQTVSKYDIFMI